MEFYDEKDLAYWRKQSELGKALIIEIPVEMLLNMDFASLPKGKTGSARVEDLQEWIDSNREEIEVALKKEASQKAEVEKLAGTLYDDTRREKENPAGEKEETVNLGGDDTNTVAGIMAREVFSDEQIAVIGEAMMEGLPDKYLLCFLKKDYSPAVMRQLKDYVTRLYREEVSGTDESKS